MNTDPVVLAAVLLMLVILAYVAGNFVTFFYERSFGGTKEHNAEEAGPSEKKPKLFVYQRPEKNRSDDSTQPREKGKLFFSGPASRNSSDEEKQSEEKPKPRLSDVDLKDFLGGEITMEKSEKKEDTQDETT